MIQNLQQYVGKDVTVYFVHDAPPISGHCCAYTPAYDNDPEIPSIDVDGRFSYTFDALEIDHIDIIE